MKRGFGCARSTRAFSGVLRFAALLTVLSAAPLLAGCGDSDPDPSGPAGNVLIQDENNYSSQSALTIPTVTTASATDLDICWDEVVDDIQCHELDPALDLDNVAFLRFLNLTEEEVQDKLTSEQLQQSDLDGYLEYRTTDGDTCTKLSSMTFLGTPIELEEEYVESDDQTYLLVLTEGIKPGVGARTMIFVEPKATSTNTRVDVGTGCGLLDFSADLVSAEPLAIQKEKPWIVDWRNITRDGQGNEVAFESIDGVLLGFYEGMTVPELQEKILDLEIMATSLWELELKSGRTADLSRAKARDGGAAFTGFTRTDGVWALALLCSSCSNPAPIVLTILEPTDGGG